MPSFDHPPTVSPSSEIKKRKRDTEAEDLSAELHLKLSQHNNDFSPSLPPHAIYPHLHDRQKHSPQLRKRSRPAEPHTPSISAPHAPLPRKTSQINLAPCHICHRKPSVRRDLDSYADCEACERRTCFVCMRECLGKERGRIGDEMMSFEGGEDGSGGRKEVGERHWRVVCSRCCCERGVDGEVWCLGCLGEGV